jgi:hypothetical protein
MSDLSTGKIAEIMFESAIETFEEQDLMLDLVTVIKHKQNSLQNAGNQIWKPIQQHTPIVDGWNVSSQETPIFEQTYPLSLGIPSNDFVKQKIDDLRDESFWIRRGQESGKDQASHLNKLITENIKNYSSLYYELDTDSGYKFLSQAQEILNERQVSGKPRYFLLNENDTNALSGDFVVRRGLEANTKNWKSGQIGQNIAEFDVFTGSFLPNTNNNNWVDGSKLLTGAIYEIPEAGSIDIVNHTVKNVDYRLGKIELQAGNWPIPTPIVGDKFKIQSAQESRYLKSVGLNNKQVASSPDSDFTATVVGVDAPSYIIYYYPMYIPVDNEDRTALTDFQKLNANVDICPLNINVIRIGQLDKKVNLFWDKSAVEVLVGIVPSGKFKEFAGMKTMSHTMKNGVDMFMIYDGNVEDMTFRFRLFTWYGITICKPQNCGIALKIHDLT